MENDRKFKLKRYRGWIHKSPHPYNDMKVQKVKRQKRKWRNGNTKEWTELY